MTCHGVARQGEDGRTHHHFISLISLIRLMQASRPRNTHTTAAIKLPVALPPAAHLCPSQTTLRFCKPSGYTEAYHGVARQGEDGGPHLVRQVRQV